jgi:hypothetical protein
MTVLEFLRSHALSLPTLAKFAIAMAVIVSVPWLSLRVRLSPVVGLLLSGVVLGPHGLDLIGENRPIADFFPIFFIVTQVSLLLQPRKFRFCIVSPANRKFTWPDPTSSDAVCLGGIANQGNAETTSVFRGSDDRPFGLGAELGLASGLAEPWGQLAGSLRPQR